MEAIAALSLAGTIFQIIDFSAKLFTLSREIYRSGNGPLSEVVDIDNLSRTLSKGLERLLFQENLQLGEYDETLKRLCSRTTTLVQEVTSILDMVKSKSGKTKWGSVKLAMKSIVQQSRIEKLEKSFKSLLAEFQLYRMIQASEHETRGILAMQELQDEMANVKDLITQYSKNVTDLIALRDERPRNLGYTWECGRQVMIDDGLGDVQPFPLDICSSIEDFMNILKIKFRSRKLPGLKQTELGHIEVLDWSETMTLTEENWSSYVNGGTGIKVSFVVGTWHWLPNNKCARCAKPRNKNFRDGSWRECGSCGLKIRQVSPETFPYEAIDISVTPKLYRDYKLRRVSHTGNLNRQDDMCSSRKHGQENTPLSTSESKRDARRHYALIDDPAIEFVSRRLTVKWEPISNIVHRYLHCRCVLRLSTPSRLPENPELTAFVLAECPRHNSEGITFQDYGNMVDNSKDPYFDRFGGYNAFRFGLTLRLNLELNSLVGLDFLPEDQLETCCEAYHNMAFQKSEELMQAWTEYDFEVIQHLYSLGFKLQSDIVDKLKTRRRLEEEAFPPGLRGLDFRDNVNWKNSNLYKDVSQILSGSWDGRPHWAVD